MRRSEEEAIRAVMEWKPVGKRPRVRWRSIVMAAKDSDRIVNAGEGDETSRFSTTFHRKTQLFNYIL